MLTSFDVVDAPVLKSRCQGKALTEQKSSSGYNSKGNPWAGPDCQGEYLIKLLVVPMLLAESRGGETGLWDQQGAGAKWPTERAQQ